jgi:hypothetical protein
MSKRNINDYLSEYESMLGEDIGSIQPIVPADIKDDPEFMKLKKQVE